MSWFSSEVASMMYAMGDSKRPNQESVALIEDLVFKQLTNVILNNSEAAIPLEDESRVVTDRETRDLAVDGLIFTLRKDELLMKRMVNYLKAKDNNFRLTKGVENVDVGGDGDFLAESVAVGEKHMEDTKRIKMLRLAFGRFDVTGEYTAMLDEEVDDPLKQMRK